MADETEKVEAYLFGPIVVKIRQRDQVWKLTLHGQTLGEGMADIRHCLIGKTAIEIGTGTGIHAIAALKLGARTVDITDIEPAALELAEQNAADNGVAYRRALLRDWMTFDPEEKYDVVMCNPPFCKAGTPDRRFFIRNLIQESPRFLREGGHLIFVQSSMADFGLTERELLKAGFYFMRARETRGVFRDYYFHEPGFIDSSRRVENGFEQIEGAYVETLRCYLCTKLG